MEKYNCKICLDMGCAVCGGADTDDNDSLHKISIGLIMCRNSGMDEEILQDCIDRLAIIQEGMILMPEEPTKEMLNAACNIGNVIDEYNQSRPLWKCNVITQRKEEYKAMVREFTKESQGTTEDILYAVVADFPHSEGIDYDDAFVCEEIEECMKMCEEIKEHANHIRIYEMKKVIDYGKGGI